MHSLMWYAWDFKTRNDRKEKGKYHILIIIISVTFTMTSNSLDLVRPGRNICPVSAGTAEQEFEATS